MYRRPKFLEALLTIRREMAREADYDVDLLAELARTGKRISQNGSDPDTDDAPSAPVPNTGRTRKRK